MKRTLAPQGKLREERPSNLNASYFDRRQVGVGDLEAEPDEGRRLARSRQLDGRGGVKHGVAPGSNPWPPEVCTRVCAEVKRSARGVVLGWGSNALGAGRRVWPQPVVWCRVLRRTLDLRATDVPDSPTRRSRGSCDRAVGEATPRTCWFLGRFLDAAPGCEAHSHVRSLGVPRASLSSPAERARDSV
jgi:hypothetical protein